MMSRSTIFLGLMLTGSLALASFMGTSSSDEVVSPVPRVYVAKGHDIAPLESEALPLEKLVREGLSEAASNPFAGRSWDPAPALPRAIPSLGEVDDKPSAPIVPFRYMGRIKEEGGRPVVFFTQGSQLYAVHEGEEIDDSHRLERILPTKLVLFHLPSKTKQILNVGSLDTDSDEGVSTLAELGPGASLRVTDASALVERELQ